MSYDHVQQSPNLSQVTRDYHINGQKAELASGDPFSPDSGIGVGNTSSLPTVPANRQSRSQSSSNFFGYTNSFSSSLNKNNDYHSREKNIGAHGRSMVERGGSLKISNNSMPQPIVLPRNTLVLV